MDEIERRMNKIHSRSEIIKELMEKNIQESKEIKIISDRINEETNEIEPESTENEIIDNEEDKSVEDYVTNVFVSSSEEESSSSEEESGSSSSEEDSGSDDVEDSDDKTDLEINEKKRKKRKRKKRKREKKRKKKKKKKTMKKKTEKNIITFNWTKKRKGIIRDYIKWKLTDKIGFFKNCSKTSYIHLAKNFIIKICKEFDNKTLLNPGREYKLKSISSIGKMRIFGAIFKELTKSMDFGQSKNNSIEILSSSRQNEEDDDLIEILPSSPKQIKNVSNPKKRRRDEEKKNINEIEQTSGEKKNDGEPPKKKRKVEKV